MFRRLAKDESGVALGLAVIMIVLIGVMGAGLLVFVRNDLEAVAEVNQGQRAINLADAGVEAAKRQLRSDAVPAHYDSNSAENVEWAYIASDGGTAGKALSLDESSTKVTIQYLLPSTNTTQLDDKNRAPELVPTDPPGQTDYPGGKNYFKIVSEGTAGEARRKVEAIFYTSKLDVPTAYYTPNDITIQGRTEDRTEISGVSFFAKGNINIVGRAIDFDHRTPALYRDWDTTNPANFNPTSKLNTIPRTDASGDRQNGAGLGTEGLICRDGNCSDSAANSVADGIHDYDKYTGTKGSNKQFIRKPNPNADNQSGKISYPFNPDAEFDLEFLMEEAKRQGNYLSSAGDITNTNYPATSNEQTVFFVDAGGATNYLDYRVNHTPIAQGTVVVRDGNLRINNSSNGFRGVIIITGDGTNTGKYDNGGSDSIEGFVIASGDMQIRGSVSPFVVTEEFTTRPGFYGVELWSWRELYE